MRLRLSFSIIGQLIVGLCVGIDSAAAQTDSSSRASPTLTYSLSGGTQLYEMKSFEILAFDKKTKHNQENNTTEVVLGDDGLSGFIIKFQERGSAGQKPNNQSVKSVSVPFVVSRYSILDEDKVYLNLSEEIDEDDAAMLRTIAEDSSWIDPNYVTFVDSGELQKKFFSYKKFLVQRIGSLRRNEGSITPRDLKALYNFVLITNAMQKRLRYFSKEDAEFGTIVQWYTGLIAKSSSSSSLRGKFEAVFRDQKWADHIPDSIREVHSGDVVEALSLWNEWVPRAESVEESYRRLLALRTFANYLSAKGGGQWAQFHCRLGIDNVEMAIGACLHRMIQRGSPLEKSPTIAIDEQVNRLRSIKGLICPSRASSGKLIDSHIETLQNLNSAIKKSEPVLPDQQKQVCGPPPKGGPTS